MVPGLTEREFHALESIRREWINESLTRRVSLTTALPKPRRGGGRTLLVVLSWLRLLIPRHRPWQELPQARQVGDALAGGVAGATPDRSWSRPG